MAIRTTAEHHGTTFLQVAIALQTLALFFQAVTAGALLTSSLGAELHDAGSRVMYGASMVYLLAAVLARRRGGGPRHSVLYASGFLLLASVQVVLGIARIPSLHVPLGVLMFGLSVPALGQALSAPWPRRSGTRA